MHSPRSSSLFLSVLLLASGAPLVTGAAEQLYTCGMHPQILKSGPGNCPICTMALTPVRANAAGATASIQIDAATIQRMNLKTAVVTRGPVRREIRTVGTVAYNEAGLRDITTKYEGWIERLFVNTTWAAVKAGEPLFGIYSPELYNAQLNYLVAVRSEGGIGGAESGRAGGALTRAALARLQLFDVPAEFIAALGRTGEAARTFVYRAPTDGVVIEKMAVAGQMTKPGERLYRLADLSSVWINAQIYEHDLPFVRAGQEAAVRASYGPERKFAGTVQTVLPLVEDQTRTATARLVLPNADGFLRPGMYVDVRLAARLADEAVLVPETAVLRSGERNTVFVIREAGTFAPREIQLGARSEGGLYEVTGGLAAGERIVTSGQFLLDSESQLREAIEKMRQAAGSDAAAAKPPPPAVDAAALRPLALALADAAAVLAADDFAGYRKQLPALRATLAACLQADPAATKGPLGEFKDGLADPDDLKEARADFTPFSTVVTDLARAAQLPRTEGLRVYECTMAPVTGTGRWLQRAAGVKNPFYGSAMLECGEELK